MKRIIFVVVFAFVTIFCFGQSVTTFSSDSLDNTEIIDENGSSTIISMEGVKTFIHYNNKNEIRINLPTYLSQSNSYTEWDVLEPTIIFGKKMATKFVEILKSGKDGQLKPGLFSANIFYYYAKYCEPTGVKWNIKFKKVIYPSGESNSYIMFIQEPIATGSIRSRLVDDKFWTIEENELPNLIYVFEKYIAQMK